MRVRAIHAEPRAMAQGGVSEYQGGVSEHQVVFMTEYIVWTLCCLLLWHSRPLRALKFLVTFLHELGHAMVAVLTCNRVSGIEVHMDGGGVTHWSGQQDRMRCSRLLVLPAGYLGSALWSAAIVVSCARDESTLWMTYALTFVLVVGLGFAIFGKNSKSDGVQLRVTLFYLALLGGLLWLRLQTAWPYSALLLGKLMLMLGVMGTLYATADIWDDCISRDLASSDAGRFAEIVGWRAKYVGIIWLLLSFLINGFALYWAFMRLPLTPVVGYPWDLSRDAMVSIGGSMLLLPLTFVYRRYFSETYQHATLFWPWC